MSEENELNRYRRQVRGRHHAAFAFHLEIAEEFEEAMSEGVGQEDDALAISLDMLVLQAYKSLLAVRLLSECGLTEDAATATRRLLELCVQAVYVGGDDVPRVCEQRAGRYLAFLWRNHPRKARALLTPEMRKRWSGIARRFGRMIPKKAKRWGPRWKEMFAEVNLSRLYDNDYALLSAIAHGSPDEQIHRHSYEKIPVHWDRPASVLLIYASRYYIGAFEMWNRRHQKYPLPDLLALSKRANEWTFRPRAEGRSGTILDNSGEDGGEP